MKKMPPALYALYRQNVATRRALEARSRQEGLRAVKWANAWRRLLQLKLDEMQRGSAYVSGHPSRWLH